MESIYPSRQEEAVTDLSQLFSDLVRYQIELWNAVDARLQADCDVTLARFQSLQVIARTESCRVFDIADALFITVGGTSKVVDRLESSGRCRRRTNPVDGRSSIIELTPAGRSLYEAATVVFAAELQQRLGAGASDSELEQLQATLTKLRSTGRPGEA